MTKYEKLLGGIYALNALDAVSTVVGISVFGAIEANPLMNAVLSRGLLVFTLVKLIVMTCACLALRTTVSKRPIAAHVVIIIAAACLSSALINNVILILIATTGQ